MSVKIKEQFVRDMQVAGLAESSQETYVLAANGFFKHCWVGAEDATERQVQDYLASFRERDAARETFRVARYALEFLFTNTLQRDWPLFKKN